MLYIDSTIGTDYTLLSHIYNPCHAYFPATIAYTKGTLSPKGLI